VLIVVCGGDQAGRCNRLGNHRAPLTQDVDKQCQKGGAVQHREQPSGRFSVVGIKSGWTLSRVSWAISNIAATLQVNLRATTMRGANLAAIQGKLSNISS
jgi:hypothetical protein